MLLPLGEEGALGEDARGGEQVQHVPREPVHQARNNVGAPWPAQHPGQSIRVTVRVIPCTGP